MANAISPPIQVLLPLLALVLLWVANVVVAETVVIVVVATVVVVVTAVVVTTVAEAMTAVVVTVVVAVIVVALKPDDSSLHDIRKGVVRETIPFFVSYSPLAVRLLCLILEKQWP